MCAQSCPTLQPHELEPTRLLCPWGFPGKPGDLPHPGIQGVLCVSALAVGFFTTAMWGVQSTVPAAFPHSFLPGLTSHFLTCALLAAEMIFHPSPSTCSLLRPQSPLRISAAQEAGLGDPVATYQARVGLISIC